MSIEVTARDTESGETNTITLQPGQFIVVCAEPAHVVSDVAYANGRNQVWVKRDREDPKASYKRPRGLCSVCGTDRGLTQFGDVVTHSEARRKGDYRRHLPRCPGSHLTPADPAGRTATGQEET